MNTTVEKTRFFLDFIKFYPEIQKENKLSFLETLIYGYIKSVIEFQEEHGNPGICFTTSETMGNNLNCKAQSINNAIQKIKSRNLIEVRNTYDKTTGKRYRQIFLPGTAPKNPEDLVSDFFDTYTDLVEDSRDTRAVIGDWLYHNDINIHELALILDDDLCPGVIIDLEHLRGFYTIFTTKEKTIGYLQSITNRKKEEGINICLVCGKEANYKGECNCDLPF